MGDVVPFRRSDRRRRQAEGNTLCRNGRHRWSLQPETRFDVKQGKLVTVYRCERCGAVRTETR
ncbi:MAG: hypothetical protein WD057_11815 [Aquisalimonadaceae bacterium]